MSAIPETVARQRAIQDRCVHPSGTFVAFREEEIEQSIPERFEQQVRRDPDRLAVQSSTQALTYAELDGAANRIAAAILARRGEGSEPVALLFEHDAPVIAGLLGVLKAGKFYAPLDPSHPPARKATILEDSQAGLLVTNSRHLPLAQAVVPQGCQLLNVDELTGALPARGPGLSISPDAFAYLVYTSGSTGRPKGVVENHRNVLHFTMSWTNRFHFCAEDRIALLSALAFSGAAGDLFTALFNGGCLCPFDIQSEGIDNLADWLIREAVTSYNTVPMLFRQWVDALTGGETFPALRVVRLGGDQVSRSDVERFQRHFAPGSVLHLGLGAAEVKHITGIMLDHETPVPTGAAPVGYAVNDNEILLLDEEGRPVGPGAIGEIAVKTRYASPGYWRQPDLTQARFLPDPEGSDARIYLTGDLGRMAADGCLFVMGRKDFQVKIRGELVETAEVEQALLTLDAVREAVVVGREHRSGDKRLVAYVVPRGTRVPTVTELRRVLAEKLPGSMLPSAFVILDVLPLTATGKLDRLALPAPGRTRPELESPFVAPRTPIEGLLAGIWGDLLALDAVGVHDPFLELGGHSLLATQMLVRVQATFQCEVPLPAFFDAPTVAGLAATLIGSEPEPGWMERIASLRQHVEQMSAAEVERMLQDRQTRK